MTDDDLSAKFTGLATPILGTAATRRLLELCWQVGKLDSVAAIAEAART
jgi:hypothetical protein